MQGCKSSSLKDKDAKGSNLKFEGFKLKKFIHARMQKFESKG